MGYSLQYQAHVDDLTSLAGSPADTAWFVLHPHEAPQAPILLAEGFFAADLHSVAAKPADVSWFTTFPREVPAEREVAQQGFFAADLHSEAGEADDVAWFTTFADKAPVERKLLPIGFFAGDIHSGSAVVYRFAKGMFKYVAAEHSSLASFYFQVVHRATTGTVYARLAVWEAPYNPLTLVAVAGSELSTTSATDVRQRTAAITLEDGKEYRAQSGKVGADAGVLEDAEVMSI